MHVKKHLSFIALRDTMAQCFRQISDQRRAAKVDYCLHDILMSGYAMMFFQDPSLLSFQQRMQDIAQLNNLLTLFGIDSIPKETQMRDIIDLIPTDELSGIFPAFLSHLQRGRQLSQYRLLNGADKQDCEINAGKRILGKIRKAHPKLPIIITADDLYSKQPFVDALKNNGMSFILTAKPPDHKILFEWVQELTDMGGEGHLEFIDMKGKRHKYHWVNDVPLNGAKNAAQVNLFQ